MREISRSEEVGTSDAREDTMPKLGQLNFIKETNDDDSHETRRFFGDAF